MLYLTKNNEVYYYIATPHGEVYFDIYNFFTMSRNSEAIQSTINWQIKYFQLNGVVPSKENNNYELTLDFLANSRTDIMNPVIDNMISYFEKEFLVIVNEQPLKVLIKELDLEDLINIVQDHEFQALNNGVTSLACSVWRVHQKL